jgi:hypothetical protein
LSDRAYCAFCRHRAPAMECVDKPLVDGVVQLLHALGFDPQECSSLPEVEQDERRLYQRFGVSVHSDALEPPAP